jgi:hypothetical protein
MEIAIIACLIAVIIYQGFFIYIQKMDYNQKEKDLLNRLMSRNYETFVQGEVIMNPKPLSPEEIFERQQERGIPV